MIRKLIRIHRPWRRLLITSFLVVLGSVGRCFSFRRRCHWIGARRRARRFERWVIVFLFLAAMLLLEPREYATWAAVFGGFTAMAVPLISLHWFWRTHWVGHERSNP